MTLDECVYALADLLEETEDANKSLHVLKDILSMEDFSVDQVVEQFTKDYVCDPEVYVENIKEDAKLLLDDEFDSL